MRKLLQATSYKLRNVFFNLVFVGMTNCSFSQINMFPVAPPTFSICDLAGYTNTPSWANAPQKLYSECPQVFVGIGTKTPTHLLTFAGNGKFLGHLWAQNALSIGADENSFSKVYIKNTNKDAGFAMDIPSIEDMESYARNSQYLMENEVLAYPNPTSDFFQLASCDGLQELSLVDQNGTLVKQFAPQEIYDISELVAGIYTLILKLKNDENKYVKMVKL